MHSKLASASAVLMLSSLAAAQTYSSCNPVKGDKCPDRAAFGGTVEVDFTSGASSYFTLADGTSLKYDGSKGAVFTIAKGTDAPTVSSTKYMFFGTVEAVIQAAPGTGIVTSFVLQSDDLDEIDWEWLGGDNAQVQTNYFSKGDTTTYDRGGFSAVSSPQTTFHTYTIDWSSDAVVWSIDGTTVRTLKYSDTNGKFPQTPMQIKLGTWDGGYEGNANGTIQWAGGLTPFDANNGPYLGYYKSLKITDKSNGVSGAKSYTYSDSSGSYTSIVVNTSDNSTDSSSSSSSSASGTKSSSKTASESASKTESSSDSKATAESSNTTATKTGASTTLATASATNGTVSTASRTGATTTPTSVTTSGVAKTGASIFGAAAALLATFVLL